MDGERARRQDRQVGHDSDALEALPAISISKDKPSIRGRPDHIEAMLWQQHEAHEIAERVGEGQILVLILPLERPIAFPEVPLLRPGGPGGPRRWWRRSWPIPRPGSSEQASKAE